MAKYLNVNFVDASLFEYSSTKIDEDFRENVSPKGKKSFRKTYPKGITGELLNVSIRNSQIGDQLQMALRESDGEIYVINFNLFDQQGNVEQNFAESVIKYLGNMSKGTIYKIFPYKLDADNQKEYDEKTEGRKVRSKYYDKFAVSIKLEDGSRVDPYLQYTGEGDNVIPEIVWRDHPTKVGKKKPSAASMEEKTDFLIQNLKEATDGHLKFEKLSQSEGSNKKEDTKQETSTGTSVDTPVNVEEDYDDLPF